MLRHFPWILPLVLPLEAGYLLLNRLHDHKQFVVEYIGICLGVSIFYLLSCWWVLQKKSSPTANGRLAYILLAGLAFRLTLAPLYPTLTDDPYRYRWEGKLLQAGGNPYLDRPDDPRWASLRDSAFSRVNAKSLISGYGPVLQWIYRVHYVVLQRLEPNAARQVLLFKIPFLVFEAGTAWMLMRLLGRTGRPREWILVYWWSPLPILEFWASGHNDPVMLFFLVTAVWLALGERWNWAMGALWGAVLTKVWPVLLFPVFVLAPAQTSRLRRAASALIWAPVAALVSWPFLRGISELSRFVAGFAGGWQNNASLFHVIFLGAHQDYERAKPLVAVLILVATLVVALLRRPLVEGVLAVGTALLMLSANCFPWYIAWLTPWLAVLPIPALLLWTALAPLSYHVLIEYQALGLWRENPLYLYLEYVPVYGLLLAGLIRRGVRKVLAR